MFELIRKFFLMVASVCGILVVSSVFAGNANAANYTISYVMNGGTNYTGAPTSYVAGVGATINGTPTQSGWTFDGWCTDSTLTTCSATQTISTSDTGDKTFYAKWSQSNDSTPCVLTQEECVAYGGTWQTNFVLCGQPGAQPVPNCLSISESVCEDLGGYYAPTGCYISKEDACKTQGGTWSNGTCTFADYGCCLEAGGRATDGLCVWEDSCTNFASYTISYVMNSGTNYTGAPTSYVAGVGATINGTPTRSGWMFEGWCTDSALTTCSTTQTISATDTGDKTFYAKWNRPTTYSISYALNGGTNYNGAPTTYTYGVGATINGTPTRADSTFLGWCTDSALTTCSITQTISTSDTGDKTFYAKWSCNTGYSSSVMLTEMSNADCTTAGGTKITGTNNGSSYSYCSGASEANCTINHGVWDSYDGDRICYFSLRDMCVAHCGTWDESSATCTAGGACSHPYQSTTIYSGLDLKDCISAIPAGVWDSTANSCTWGAETCHPINYVINYELNGGTQAVTGVPTTYTYGVGETVNGTPTQSGWTFEGWCTDAGLSQCAFTHIISTTDTGNKTFYAKWSQSNDSTPCVLTQEECVAYGGNWVTNRALCRQDWSNVGQMSASCQNLSEESCNELGGYYAGYGWGSDCYPSKEDACRSQGGTWSNGTCTIATNSGCCVETGGTPNAGVCDWEQPICTTQCEIILNKNGGTGTPAGGTLYTGLTSNGGTSDETLTCIDGGLVFLPNTGLTKTNSVWSNSEWATSASATSGVNSMQCDCSIGTLYAVWSNPARLRVRKNEVIYTVVEAP